jgi:hypothetical protein
MSQISDEQPENALRAIVELLKSWMLVFLNQWKILFIFLLIGTGLGIYKAYKTKPSYTAELTFSLDEKSGGSSFSGLASQLGIDVGAGSSAGVFSGDNNMELIKSRVIVEKSILSPVIIDGKTDLLINRHLANTNFYENSQEKPELYKELVFVVGQSRDTYTRAQDSLIYQIYKDFVKNSIQVTKPDKRLNIFHVSFTSTDEMFAKLFSEILVKNVSSLYIETKTRKYKNNVAILENRLDSVRKELNQDISGAAILKDQNSNIIRAQATVQSSKKQLNVQILTTMYGELTKNLEIAKYSLLREEPIIQVIDSPILPLEKKVQGKVKGGVLGGVIGLVLSMFLVLLIYIKQNYF